MWGFPSAYAPPPPPARPARDGHASPTPTPAPRRPRRSGVWAGLGILAVVALIASALGVVAGRSSDQGNVTATSARIGKVPVDEQTRELPSNISDIEVAGSATGAIVTTATAALAEIDQFWRANWSEVGRGSYQTIGGGFVAASARDAVSCAGQRVDVQGNAFYCPEDDKLVFDAQSLLPQIQQKFGPLAVGVILAHEWGHAISARAGLTQNSPTVLWEQQADCYAGSWVAGIRDNNDGYLKVDDSTLDLALAAMVSFKDPLGTDPSDPAAHGTAFDRIRAFQEGVESGPKTCDAYTADDLPLVSTPFLSQDDYYNGGNLPLQDAYDAMNADLKTFWTDEWPKLAKGTFSNPEVVVYGQGEDSTGGSGQGRRNKANRRRTRSREPDRRRTSRRARRPSTSPQDVFYCPSSNTIAMKADGTVVTATEQIGDNALGELLGVGYALSAVHQLDGSARAGVELSEQADCLRACGPASVFDGTNDPEASDGLLLSPGDLDEAVMTLLDHRRPLEGLHAPAPASIGWRRIVPASPMDVSACNLLTRGTR